MLESKNAYTAVKYLFEYDIISWIIHIPESVLIYSEPLQTNIPLNQHLTTKNTTFQHYTSTLFQQSKTLLKQLSQTKILIHY